jgi:hypothetical protein
LNPHQVLLIDLSLDFRTNDELCSLSVPGDEVMFKAVIQEAAALASLALFIGMIAIWTQVLGSL